MSQRTDWTKPDWTKPGSDTIPVFGAAPISLDEHADGHRVQLQ